MTESDYYKVSIAFYLWAVWFVLMSLASGSMSMLLFAGVCFLISVWAFFKGMTE